MKPKSPNRLKSELRKKLLPEIDLPTLALEIGKFLNTRAGQAARGHELAIILAGYLTQKYLIADRNTGQLCRLIEHHAGDLAAFLDQIAFKEFQAFVKKAD